MFIKSCKFSKIIFKISLKKNFSDQSKIDVSNRIRVIVTLLKASICASLSPQPRHPPKHTPIAPVGVKLPLSRPNLIYYCV